MIEMTGPEAERMTGVTKGRGANRLGVTVWDIEGMASLLGLETPRLCFKKEYIAFTCKGFRESAFRKSRLSQDLLSSKI